MTLHFTKGSPVKPDKQVQAGEWLIVLHSEFEPQVPGHGFAHFRLIQAWLAEQSALFEHWGLQFGGVPT